MTPNLFGVQFDKVTKTTIEMSSNDPIWSDKSTVDHYSSAHVKGIKSHSRHMSIAMIISIICLVTTASALALVLTTLDKYIDNDSQVATPHSSHDCADNCRYTIVESIPENLTFSKSAVHHPSTFWALSKLLKRAEFNVSIAAFYWTLLGTDLKYHDNSSWQGEKLFEMLKTAGKSALNVRIAQSYPTVGSYYDTEELEKYGVNVRKVNFTRLLGSGVLHTKLWVVDNKHFYVGSANMDWRSLTQVKELGILVEDCSCLATDVANLFSVYWYLGDPSSTIPDKWPPQYSTDINETHPLTVSMNETNSTVYLSSSPPEFCPQGRTNDIDAIISVINNAKEFIYIAVMDFIPMMVYTKRRKYWPVINDALKIAAIDRNISVRILGSYWNHTDKDMLIFLKSFKEISNLKKPKIHLEVKLFVVPVYSKSQRKIPFARVNHNKYMVTDQVAYIGTSNWSGDYFTNTGGVGIVVNITSSVQPSNNAQRDLKDVFLRDWNSEYSHNLDEIDRMNKL